MDEKSLAKLIENILDNKSNPVLKTLDELKYKINKIDKIEESINFLSSKYDELISKSAIINDTMKVVQEENQCLREKLHAAVNNVEMLKLEVNNMEQYSRRDTRNPHNNRREHQQIS
jgi:predicted metal-dependent hydrolase